jgi:hypothetical protein
MRGKVRLAAGPAPTMTARFQGACARKPRPSSSPGPSSPRSPAIFTYPPSGTQATWYSVSPRVKAKMLGPKPMENRVTFTSSALAARKCPSSCTKMSTLKRTMK